MSNIREAYTQNYKIIPLLIVAAIWYLALTSILSIPQMWLERRYGRRLQRRAAHGRIARVDLHAEHHAALAHRARLEEGVGVMTATVPQATPLAATSGRPWSRPSRCTSDSAASRC